MEALVAKLQELLALYGLNVLSAILIVIIGRWVAMGIRKVLRAILTKSKVDEMLISFVCSLGYFTLLTFIIIAAISRLGIQTASFIAVLGAAGLAIGLALQGSLANFAAGVLMMIFKPIKIGDFVEAGGVAGVVEDLEIFTTQMRTPDNKTIIVPNSKITGENIVNYSTKDTRRVDMVVGVSYSDDLGKVKQAVEAVLAADERVLKDPAPTVAVSDLGDSSVNFVVRPWVKTADYWNVKFALTRAVKERFDAEGISIPFPQRDIHMYQAEA